MIHYQYRADWARRTLRGIDEQVAKAQRGIDGKTPVKRYRYIQLTGATKSVSRTLEAKTRTLAGWKGYTTNMTSTPATTSRPKPAGASRNSCAPHAATARSASPLATRHRPPPTPSPPTSLPHRPKSAQAVRTNLIKVGLQGMLAKDELSGC